MAIQINIYMYPYLQPEVSLYKSGHSSTLWASSPRSFRVKSNSTYSKSPFHTHNRLHCPQSYLSQCVLFPPIIQWRKPSNCDLYSISFLIFLPTNQLYSIADADS